MNFGKCSKCGCEGIHACMGDPKTMNNLDIGAKYDNIKDAIEHIRQSEEKLREERKDDEHNSGS